MPEIDKIKFQPKIENLQQIIDNDNVSPALIRGKEIWTKVRRNLQQAFGETLFNSWLKSLQIIEYSNGHVVLSAPTRFIRQWVINNYLDKILLLCQFEDNRVKKVEIRVAASKTKRLSSVNAEYDDVVSATSIQGKNIRSIDDKDNGDTLSSPLDRRFTFDNFIVGYANKLAFAAAQSVAGKKISDGSNPLFIYGGVGLGKTHLMHAIAWQIKHDDPGRKVIYLSAEKFMYQFMRAIRNKDLVMFKEKLRRADVLLIDDIQFISGKEGTQQEFYHTFNALIDMKRQVVISCDRAPSELIGLDDRIRSRLGWGLVADIGNTDYQLRLGILKSKVKQMQHKVEVPTDVLEFLACKITSNIRELEGALNKVIAHSTLVGSDINLKLSKEILSDLLKANEKVITVDLIKRKTAEHYGITVKDIISARRMRSVARPRQVAMYLAKQLTQRSLSEIGSKFGRKDHTTVIHAVRKIEELKAKDKDIAQDLESLASIIKA